MDIIAISLGLIPVPPLPPAVRERQHRIVEERERCNPGERMPRMSATAYRAAIVQLLRDTGPGSSADLAASFGTTGKHMRAHLARMLRDGQVRCDVIHYGTRNSYVWHAAEAGDA